MNWYGHHCNQRIFYPTTSYEDMDDFFSKQSKVKIELSLLSIPTIAAIKQVGIFYPNVEHIDIYPSAVSKLSHNYMTPTVQNTMLNGMTENKIPITCYFEFDPKPLTEEIYYEFLRGIKRLDTKNLNELHHEIYLDILNSYKYTVKEDYM